MKLLSVLISILLYCSYVQAKKKHVVIIMADDLGFNDVSYRGSTEIPTPNIDALAYHGIVMDRFYTPPLCTPSRGSLMTAKYPHHIGLQHNVAWNDEPYGLGLEHKLMPEYFRESGYKTHLVGKWHLGFYQEQYTPTRRGFDTHFGYLGPWIDYWDHTFIMFDRNYSRGLDLRKNLDISWNHNGTYGTDLITRKAINVIENHNQNKPLFLLVTQLAPHAGNDDFPLQGKPDDIAQFGHITAQDRKVYASMVKSLDDSVGNIVQSLVKTGMMDDTILVFYSDNGGPTTFKVIHPTTANNYPLRGEKGFAWEGGIRTDCIIYSPFLPQTTIRKNLFHVIDFLPTLSTLAEAKLQITDEIDGMDLSAMILEEEKPHRRDVVTTDDIYGISSLILDNYKLLNGTFVPLQGIADTWLGSIANKDHLTFDQYADLVISSKVAKSLKKYNIAVGKATIGKMRKKFILECVGVRTSCNLLQAPCLFDIDSDPCEEVNLAPMLPDILANMQSAFAERTTNISPIANKDPDPRCDPANFNYTWTWWEPDS